MTTTISYCGDNTQDEGCPPMPFVRGRGASHRRRMQDQDLDQRILPLREDRLTFIAAREFPGVAGGRPAATGLPTVKRINKQD